MVLREGRGGRLYNPKVDPSVAKKRAFLIESMQFRPPEPIEVPIFIACIFWFPLPSKSGPLKKLYSEFESRYLPVIEQGDALFKISYFIENFDNEIIKALTHASLPDTTNLLKFVEDALQGKFWVNDSQIQDLGWKIYSPEPRTEIEILWAK